MEQLLSIFKISVYHNSGYELTLGHLMILVIGILAILIVNFILSSFIKRSKLIVGLGDKFKKIVQRIIRYIIWILGIILLLKLINLDTKRFFAFELYKGDELTITVQKIFIIFFIILFIRMVVLVVDFIMNRRVEQNNLDIGKSNSIIKIVKYLIWMLGVLIAISSTGIELTFVIASVSALLVGIGFGLQNIFNDFFSGIIILFDGSVKVNDVVQFDDNVGRVVEIGLRTSHVLTRDNIILIVPNSHLTQSNIINWSLMDQKSRFNVGVGVAYGSDVSLVEKVLLKCADAVNDIEQHPKPFVRFEAFGDSSLDFKIYFWSSNNFEVENIKSKLRFEIDKGFRENNITIPFPQRDLHIIK